MNQVDGTLLEICHALSQEFNLNELELLAAMQEDKVGGYDDAGTWMGGSVYGVEGQVLYGLVRVLRPASVVQLGGWVGCSATHIGMAIRANGFGHLWSVDIDANQCSRLWSEARPHVSLVHNDAVGFLNLQDDEMIDLIFEDTGHTVELTQAITEAALRPLKTGGMLLHHDAGHYRVGADVRQGIDQAGWTYTIYKPFPAECGLAIGRK